MNKPLLKVESLALMGRGVVLHGSSVETPSGAVVLLARSGGGKSTVARMLAGSGLRLIGDDVTLVARGSDSVLRAMPCGSYIPGGGQRPGACALHRLALLEFGPFLYIPRLDPVCALYRCMRQSQIMIFRSLSTEERATVTASLSEIIEERGCGLLRFSLDTDPGEISEALRS
jgi:energy-coupling factor transporter ATP-binding protein EcfA2